MHVTCNAEVHGMGQTRRSAIKSVQTCGGFSGVRLQASVEHITVPSVVDSPIRIQAALNIRANPLSDRFMGGAHRRNVNPSP